MRWEMPHSRVSGIYGNGMGIKKIFIIYSNNIQTFPGSVCYTKYIRNAQSNKLSFHPFWKSENPKENCSVPLGTELFLCIPYVWFSLSPVSVCNTYLRFSPARTSLNFSTFPSSKQYPSIPQRRAPSMLSSRSSTKKHSSGFRWNRSKRWPYISFWGFRHRTSAENRMPSKHSTAGSTSL